MGCNVEPDEVTHLSEPIGVFFYAAGFGYSILSLFALVVSLIYIFKGMDAAQFLKLTNVPLVIFGLLGLIILYAYVAEIVVTFRSGGKYELEAFKYRLMGPYAYVYFAEIVSFVVPITFLLTSVRKSVKWICVCALLSFLLSKASYIQMWVDSVRC